MKKTVTFPRWPTWNFHFPELDVRAITGVHYIDAQGTRQSLALELVRLAVGVNGVSALVFKEKHNLPPTVERADAVTVEYEG